LERQQIARISKCLWEFQEMTPEIYGLVLFGAEGFVVASTLTYTPSISRVAAVSAALVGLAKQCTAEWERGNFEEVRVRYRDEDDRQWDAQLLPVTLMYTLAVVIQRPPALSVSNIVLSFNTQQAQHYVASVLNGADDPPRITWM
jgi:hypothetical protein